MRRTSRLFIAILLVISLVVAVNLLPNRHTQRTNTAYAQVEATGMLKQVLDRGRLICGVNGQLPGFSYLDPNTNTWSGLDVDYCKAIAAAIFGEVTDSNLEYLPVTAAERFTALAAGTIDVLSRNTTWTFQRDTDLKGDFAATTFYDGQGLMVRADLGVSSINDLDGASICTQTGTTTELNITEAMNSLGFGFELVALENASDTMTAFEAGRCDVLTSDKSQLAGLRSASADPSLYVILPDTLSKEPLGIMYLEGDAQWANVIDWTVYATFQAEEYGITSANIDEFLTSTDTAIQRFLGTGEDNFGGYLGLSKDFVVNVIRAVGNYGEIYERNIVPIGINRAGTLNASWRDGGLIYAPAWR